MAGQHDSRLVRALFLTAGGGALLLGLIGIVLPVLPTAPFILLAAACFARGSQRLHDALLAQRVAGPIIRQWQQHRSMPPGVKPWALVSLAVSFGVSIALVPAGWHRLLLLLLALVLAGFLWRVPVRRRNDDG